jgi:hypothetical protein
VNLAVKKAGMMKARDEDRWRSSPLIFLFISEIYIKNLIGTFSSKHNYHI